MTGSYYDFPRLEKFLGSDTERERQSNCHVKRTVRSAGFRSLVTLRLGFVNEHFLGNCPFLELLQVTRSSSIRNLRVAGPSLKLKWLEISQCTLLKRLEISATNLVSLTYKGPLAYKLGTSTKVILENVQALSELCTDGAYCASVVLKPTPHMIHLRQRGSLKLVLPEEFVKQYRTFPRTFPEQPCLKQLEIELRMPHKEVLIYYTSWIKSCPSLS